MATKAQLEAQIVELQAEVARLRAALGARRPARREDEVVRVSCCVCKEKVEMTFASARGWRKHEDCSFPKK